MKLPSVLGKTRSGAALTADVSAGVATEDARFRFEIRGSEGRLSLTSDHPYGFQAGDLKVTSSISGGLMGAAINVGEVYAQLVHDVHAGTTSPSALNTPFTTPALSRLYASGSALLA